MPYPCLPARTLLKVLSLTGAFCVLLSTNAAGQWWYTPEPNCYPDKIDAFAGSNSIYGYNDRGDMFAPMSSYEVWHNRWRISWRGSLTGLNCIDNSLGCAVGNSGAIWRMDSKSQDYFIPTTKITDADLLSVCRYYVYKGTTRYLAVGRRGSIVIYYPSVDSSTIVTENGHPDLYRIAQFGESTFCAVGDSGCILVSKDIGRSWTRKDRDPRHQYRGIAMGDGVVLLTGLDAATGEGLVVRTDREFKGWMEYRFPQHTRITGARYGRGNWFVFGDNGLMARSADSARTWQNTVHGTRINFNDILISGWNVTAVGKSPSDGHFRSIISSDSGRSWKVWIEAEDSLGTFSIPRTGEELLVTERGFIFSRESSYKYPSQVRLGVPYALLSCAVLNYRTWVVGGADGRVLISNDQGKNWRSTQPLSDDVITLERCGRDSLMALTRDSRIYRSADSGITWHLAYAAPQGRTITRIQCELGDTCLAIGREGSQGAAWISFDGGARWITVMHHAAEITGIDVDSVGVLHLCTADGLLYRSTDNGASWSIPLARHGSRFTDVAVGSRTRIYLIEGSDGILTSKDAGETWSEQRFKGQILDRVQAWDRGLMAWGGYNTIFSYGDYWWFRDELGSMRERILSAVSDTAWKFICVGENGLVLLNNWTYSQNWESRRILAPVSDNLNDITQWNAKDLLAVSDGGTIIKSTQPGVSWEIMYLDPAGRSLTQVMSFPSGLAIAAGPDVLLRVMPDDSGWVEESRYPGGILAAPAQRGWYTACRDGRVYFSEDDGRSWEYRSMVSHSVQDCRAFDAANLFVLSVDTSDGSPTSIIYRSTDYAATWMEVFRMRGVFSTLRLFDGSRVMLCGEEGTVFISDDHGRSWMKTRSRFRTTFREIVPAGMRSSSGTTRDYLFLANMREMDLLTMSFPLVLGSDPLFVPSDARISALYPNPAASLLQVEIAGNPAGNPERIFRLALHDLLGREVLVQEFEVGNPEMSHATMDVARLARGTYILRLSGEGMNDARLVRLQ